MARKPDFFIVGAAKAGTTSLARYLAQHPRIFIPKFKEPHYYSAINPDGKMKPFFPHIEKDADYVALFRAAKRSELIGEASTSYLWDTSAPLRIRQDAPAAKIVILLRDPVERAYSHYLNDVREGTETREFRRAITEDHNADRKGWGITHLYLEIGMYARQIQRYYDTFPENQIKILIFEEFVKDLENQTASVLEFLGIDPGAADNFDYGIQNAYSTPRFRATASILHSGYLRQLSRIIIPTIIRQYVRRLLLTSEVDKPAMSAEMRNFLCSYYADEILAVENLIGKVTAWNRANDIDPLVRNP